LALISSKKYIFSGLIVGGAGCELTHFALIVEAGF